MTAEELNLKDGEYTAEVTMEGGSGRATIDSPTDISVKDGKVTAEIKWSSSHYDYMLVDGEKFLPVNTEGNSVFEVPVAEFDKPMTVMADTTAMSVPHEIEYTLTFALTLTKSGSRYNSVLSWEGSDAQKITAELVPEAALKGNGDGNFVLEWRSRSGAVKAENGVISADTGASWITEAMKKYPYTAETTDEITVKAGTIEKKIPVKLTFKLVDRTWSGSSGGHSSGSGSTGSVLKKLQNTGEQPKGSIAGEWRKEADGSWRFVSGGKTYAGEWACIYNPYAKEGQEKTSWFHFASDGRMQTGWFLDEKDGSWYYLRKTSDGNQGKMQTGWLKEGEKWYYLGPTGRMTKGWNWIDGKCYYMDQKNGHMLADCVTPDGYTVDETGAWCVRGAVQTIGKK